MPVIDCIRNVLAKIPGATPDDVENLHKSMVRMRADAFAEGITNPDSAFAEKAEKALKGFVESIQRKETEALENIGKLAKVKTLVDDPLFGKRSEGMMALAGGSSVKVEGAKDSIMSRGLAIKRILSNAFILDLDEKNNPGITDIFTSNVLGREIAQAVHTLSGGQELPGPVSAEVSHIAKAIYRLNKLTLDTLNKAGASVNDLAGYIARQTHDPDLIRKLGATNDERFGKWKDFILPLLDHQKTFFRDFFEENPEKYLRAIFDDIMEGRSGVLQSESSDSFVKTIGTPSNLARKLEMGRKLFFKDGYAEYDYNQQFGAKAINEQVASNIYSTARNAAAMEKLGTNWKATWERLQNGMEVKEQRRLSRMMDVMDGTSTRPGSSPVAVAGHAASMALDLAKMGPVLASHFGLLASRAATMMVGGDNILSAHIRSVTSALHGILPENQAEAMRLTGINAETQITHIMADIYAGQGTKPGKMAQLHKFLFTINGMGPAVKALSAGFGQSLAAELGANAGKDFHSLPAGLGRAMFRAGIDPVKWDVARLAVENSDNHGAVLGYGKIGDIPHEQVQEIMGKAGLIPEGTTPKGAQRLAEKMRSDVQQQIAGYYSDMNDAAMGKPGFREKADYLVRGGLDDTVSGQAWRLFMKYKAFPISMTTRWGSMLSREVLAEQSAMAKVGTISGLATSTMLLGYLGYSAKEIAMGRSPPNPFDKNTMLKSMVKGGTLGMVGDFLLSNIEDQGRLQGGLSTAAGPFFGQAPDVIEMFRDVFGKVKPGGKGRWTKAAGQGLRVVENNVPFSNMPVLRPAVDGVFLNDIAERLNHGYLARHREKMKEAGQHSIFGN